ncbi:LysR family transcriptional regulator [Sabulicella glaciei]|uniref:LysR family transcriptional regulator n=1 Tax=Sabulicella glaciei TaxID=2984948 RepID=A0ABT3NZ22_9PROT|nr:LysR family transcriptional regulator [Roseococcus sp. MDT2-1-1]MCW8087408.1 LysR family transcriptional regulator [Roseococcus sp. MDT2-1-1]
MPRQLDWSTLLFFLELARQGRLAPAARRLRVDHTTVSRRVAELEKALDLKLFDRTADGFALTEAGRTLMPHAEAMEAQVLAIADHCAAPGAGVSGRVRVASMEGIAAQYLARRLPRLVERHPGLTVELVTSPALFNLTKREADISLSFVPMRGPKLEIRRIGGFALFLYASPAYLAAHGTPEAPEDLAHHRFVDYVEDLVQIPEVHWLLDVVSSPQVCFRSSSMYAQATAAANGAGLVLLPSFAGETDPRLVPVLKPHVRTERPVYLAVHEDLAWVPRLRETVRFLEETLASDHRFLLEGAEE